MVAVVGGAVAGPEAERVAEAVGDAAARMGAVVLTGGRGGVMAAASRGARQARGEEGSGPPVVALLPGTDRAQANPWAELVLPTGLGNARNALIVAGADVVVAIGGGPGTLSEIGLARKEGRPVIVVAGTGGVADRGAALLPEDPGLHVVVGAAEAIALLARLLPRR